MFYLVLRGNHIDHRMVTLFLDHENKADLHSLIHNNNITASFLEDGQLTLDENSLYRGWSTNGRLDHSLCFYLVLRGNYIDHRIVTLFIRRQIITETSLVTTANASLSSLQIFGFPIDSSTESGTRRATERFAKVGTVVDLVGHGRIAVAAAGPPVVMANYVGQKWAALVTLASTSIGMASAMAATHVVDNDVIKFIVMEVVTSVMSHSFGSCEDENP